MLGESQLKRAIGSSFQMVCSNNYLYMLSSPFQGKAMGEIAKIWLLFDLIEFFLGFQKNHKIGPTKN